MVNIANYIKMISKLFGGLFLSENTFQQFLLNK